MNELRSRSSDGEGIACRRRRHMRSVDWYRADYESRHWRRVARM